MKITRLPVPRCIVGEGPLWDAAAQVLYFVDIFGKKIHCYDPHTEQTRTWDTPQAPGALALREKGGLAVAMQDTIEALNLDTGRFTTLAKVEKTDPRVRFNDGKTDRGGKFFVFGSGLGGGERPSGEGPGALYSVSADHKIQVLDTGIALSNSHCFSPDGKTLYFSDTFSNCTCAYDYDPQTGRTANKRVFVDLAPLGGMPDGATVDRDGLVWIAVASSQGTIAAFRPDGKLERTIQMPVKLAVSVMFGGPDLDLLYVTTIDGTNFGIGVGDDGGYTHVVEGLGARGLPEARYAG